jgi:hypothetical protein
MKTIKGFTIHKGLNGDIFVHVNENKLAECVIFCKELNAKGLMCRGGLNFHKSENLEFLKLFTFIEKIDIQFASHLKDLSGLKYLPLLSSLSIFTPDNKKQLDLDLSHAPQLKSLNIDWHSKITNAKACTQLEFLRLDKYKSPTHSFTDFLFSDSLKIMHFVYGNIKSLKGIKQFKNLKELKIYYNYGLTNIDEISHLSESLSILTIENSKKITDFTAIKKLTNLKELYLFGNNIDSIAFVKDLPNLKTFSFYKSNVLDGDMSPLLERKWDFIAFSNKRGFSYKLEEVRKLTYNDS